MAGVNLTRADRCMCNGLGVQLLTGERSERVDRRAAAFTSGASILLGPYWPVYPTGTVALVLATVALFDTMYCGTSVRLNVTLPLV